MYGPPTLSGQQPELPGGLELGGADWTISGDIACSREPPIPGAPPQPVAPSCRAWGQPACRGSGDREGPTAPGANPKCFFRGIPDPQHILGDRPILLSPTAPDKGPPTPAGDRKVTQPPQPPPQTHTLRALLWKKGGFHFLFFPSKHSYSSVPAVSHGSPWAGPGVCGQPFSILAWWRVPSSGQAVWSYCACWEKAGLWRPQLAPYYIGFY